MAFKDFSKSLSSEIENLFATLGDNNLPEASHRLDKTVPFDEIMEQLKNSDTDKSQHTQD